MKNSAICVVVLACALPSTVLGNHDTAQAILGKWKLYESNLYVLQPPKSTRPLEVMPADVLGQDLTKEARRFLKDNLSLILIHKGKIVFEGYANGADQNSKLSSYSMAKSLTALAVGEALCAGKIKSLDEKAGNIAKALGDSAYGKSSLRNLLGMASGAQEPRGDPDNGIHDLDEWRKIYEQRMPMSALFAKYGKLEEAKDGTRWVYNGLNIEALGHVIAASTGMPLQQWFEQTVWQKAGGESALGWIKDNASHGFAETGIFGAARDYARIGLYALERLNGEPNEPCVSQYLREAATSQFAKYSPVYPGYGFAMHIDNAGNPWFSGHGGQGIGMNPKSNTLLATHSFARGRGYWDSLFALWSAFNEWAQKH
jgi:CubicO group peptidase (beta-lactamase class C family)